MSLDYLKIVDRLLLKQKRLSDGGGNMRRRVVYREFTPIIRRDLVYTLGLAIHRF